jgi:hypothetical protein
VSTRTVAWLTVVDWAEELRHHTTHEEPHAAPLRRLGGHDPGQLATLGPGRDRGQQRQRFAEPSRQQRGEDPVEPAPLRQREDVQQSAQTPAVRQHIAQGASLDEARDAPTQAGAIHLGAGAFE